MKKRILFVDDEPNVLEALERMLRPQQEAWTMTYTDRPQHAWEQLLQTAYDAVVTDIKMPGMSGLDLLERIQQTEQTRDLPVVILTGLGDRGLKQRALEMGATDLLAKPIDSGQLVARIHSVLRVKAAHDDLKHLNALLEEKIRRQNRALAQSRLSVVCRLGNAAEQRDEQTGNHVIRVGCYSRAIAAALNLDRAFVEMLLLAAPLHDIGKIGIPDSILLKRGPLSPGEWATMQRHCVIGERILREQSKVMVPLLDWCAEQLQPLDELSELSDPVLEMAATVALTHHEKWDGTGYPLGLAGTAISIESRIVALADTFDALCSERPYHPPFSEPQALAILRDSAGSHFDPEVYAAFLTALPEVRRLRQRFADGVEALPDLEEPGA